MLFPAALLYFINASYIVYHKRLLENLPDRQIRINERGLSLLTWARYERLACLVHAKTRKEKKKRERPVIQPEKSKQHNPFT
jgi:hypothetical protein